MLSFRRFHLAFLAVAGLCVTSATSRAVDPRLLPADTEIVFSINVKQILNSELVKSKPDAIKTIRAQMENPLASEGMKYLKDMGFDPLTHLNSITIAHPGTMDAEAMFIVIDGVIDAKKFAVTAAAAAKDNPGSMKVSRFGTTSIYEVTVGEKTAHLALVNGKSLVISSKEDQVKEAITRAAGTTVAAGKVRDLLKTTTDKQSLSFVITGEAMGRFAQQAPQGKGDGTPDIGKALESIQGLSGAITLTKEINFQLGVGAKDEKGAREIVDVAKQGLGVLQFGIGLKAMQEPDVAVFGEILKTVKISSVGTNAVLTGSVSQENLETILKAAGKKFRGF